MNNLHNSSSKQNNLYTSKIYMSTKKVSKAYDYFSIKIPLNYIKNFIKTIKDERFLFFITYGILRRYEGDCDIIFVEIPQIPKKLVIYRKPDFRYKLLYKMNLNNKDLPHIPLFEGEENLKFLSLEQNWINKIDKLVSLNNLIYLNLYGNRITEIENLTCNTKLKILLLGKNFIERIKNLNFLTELEILDLHSNKIKLIENIENLKKLRILNLANNQIASIKEIIENKKLEELNVRKNIIEIIPNLSDFPPLKRINIEKNLISKMEYLTEFKKLKFLQEIILDYNPVLNSQNVMDILKSLPIKESPCNLRKNNFAVGESQKNWLCESTALIGPMSNRNDTLNLSKSSAMMRITNDNKILFENKLKTKNKRDNSNNKISFSKEFIYVRNKVSKLEIKGLKESGINNKLHNLSQTKNAFKQKDNNKIIDIRFMWNNEMNLIRKKGYNGYNNKKFRLIDIDQGHVEIEGKETMKLYGNCLKVLKDTKYYKIIKALKFEYFYYDFIMSKKILNYIKNFINMNSIIFDNNNIYSFYQLIRLENFENLEDLCINNNEICCSHLLIYFVAYRLSSLKFFNHEQITDNIINLSRDIFEYFDKIISVKEKEIDLEKNKNNKDEEKKNQTNEDLTNNNKKEIKQYEDYWKNEELKYCFVKYAKFNLSVAIESIIIDEEREDT